MSGTERVEAPVPAPKEDPESLVLRGRPRSAIRFRRGLIIGVAGTAAAAFIGLAWVALEPPSFRFAGVGDEQLSASRVSADGLADAPATYADVPHLGSPLPGDLGRPIVDQQRKLADGRDGLADAGRDVEAERAAARAAAAGCGRAGGARLLGAGAALQACGRRDSIASPASRARLTRRRGERARLFTRSAAAQARFRAVG